MGADPSMQEAINRISALNPEPSKPISRPTDDQPKEAKPVESETKVETSQDDTQTEEPTYTVKYNGEEVEVPLSELKLGYMREKDYRVKMHNVSDKSKTLEAKLSSLDEKISDAESLIDIDLSYLESEEGKQLKEDNPSEFIKRVETIQKRADKLKAHKAEKAKRETEAQKERLREENEKLRNKISDWLDEDVKARDTKDIVKYLSEKQGYSQEEIAGITDHRVFATAFDAVKLERIMSKDLSSKEAKEIPKSAKPGSSETKPRKSEADKARDKLSKSGDMKDAAEYFKKALFGNK